MALQLTASPDWDIYMSCCLCFLQEIQYTDKPSGDRELFLPTSLIRWSIQNSGLSSSCSNINDLSSYVSPSTNGGIRIYGTHRGRPHRVDIDFDQPNVL